MTSLPAPAVKPIMNAESLYGAVIRQIERFAVRGSSLWSAYNPSICHTDKYGTLILFRSTNGYLKDWREEFQMPLGYELDGYDSYRYPAEFNAFPALTTVWEKEPVIHNRMFLARMQKHPNTKISDLHEVDLSEAYEKAPTKILRGVEDGRLFWDGKSLKILGTVQEVRGIPASRICEIELEVEDFRKARGVSFTLFDSPSNRSERNWMPVHQNGMKTPPLFDFVYESGYTYSKETNAVTPVGGFEFPFKGGSQLVPLSDGTYLGVVHQVPLSQYMRFSDIKKSPILRRRYVHRFVQYTEQGQVFKISEPFNFLNKSVEFAAGLAIRGDKVLVTFGVLDSSAHLAVMSLYDVLKSLHRPSVSTE